MDEGATEFVANAEQAEYWNSAGGERWVSFQAEYDRRLEPVNAILIAQGDIAEGDRVIDVGCGTGTIALLLAELVGPRGTVLGVDISELMLARAGQRRAERGLGQVRFERLDAQTHAFAPAAFDRLISRFGVMFFGDPVAAFGNLRRALRPDGRLAFVCWAPLEANPWFAIPIEIGARWLGPPEPQPPRAPGPFAFSDERYVEEVLSAAGYVDIGIERIDILHPGAATVQREAELACHLGPLARLLRDRQPDEATRARIVAEIAERFAPFETAVGIRAPGAVFRVSARAP